MRKFVNRSKRKLTGKELVVDWAGNKVLIYRMTRKQAESLFDGSISVYVSQKLREDPSDIVSFPVVHKPGGKFSIGCEDFNRDEVRELKRWVKGGKCESKSNKKRG